MSDLLQKYNERFGAELARLNAAQRAAVDQLEGPVLVIAGPGTGKTHILAARIGRILLETDAQAHNILCLTFTDAGVRAMRRRLLSLIGPEAHRVHIFTFHSFCNKVIQENLEYFGQYELEPISTLENIDILHHMLAELPPEHPLIVGRMATPFFYTQHLADLFARMKKEDWSPDYIYRKVDEYLAELPGRKAFTYQRSGQNYSAGSLKTAQLELEQARMARLRAAAELFERYDALVRQQQRYDYDDMILWVLRAFQQNDTLLRSYQEQYLYFLVDEYQDTSGAQNEVLYQLIGYWSQPNVFIVGDDDQSIFEFQGARLHNLVAFYHRYEQWLRLVVLTENYRSSQLILNSAHQLIQGNSMRIGTQLSTLGIEKLLQARHPDFAITPTGPAVVEYTNRLQELTGLTNAIEHLRITGVPLDDVAVIYAEHKQARQLVGLLERKGIPYQVRRKINLLDLVPVQQIRTLLQYLHIVQRQPSAAEALLFRILHFQFWGISSADLATLTLHFAKAEQSHIWLSLLSDSDFLSSLSLKNAGSILQAGEVLAELSGFAANEPVPALLEKVINRTGILRMATGHPDSQWLLQVLYSLHEFVQQEAMRDPRLSLGRLLEVLDTMDANRVPLEVLQTSAAGQRLQLLTAHSAKGLEFRHVFMLDCVDETWEPKSRRSRYSFPMPDTLTFSPEEDALEARRRLFYVAMTRAKESLTILYSRLGMDGKELQRAVFVDELLAATDSEAEQAEVSAAQLAEAKALLLSEPPTPSGSIQDPAALNSLLQDFRLSVSALNRYLDCPLSFYYEYILKVPSQESEASLYGKIMHATMQKIFEQMLASKTKRFPTEDVASAIFEKEIRRRRGFFGPAGYERVLAGGRQNLVQYVRQHADSWCKQVKLECRIQNAQLNGIPLTGVIDKIEFLDHGAVNIVDYKTGSSDEKKWRRPTEKNPNGGIYWRQLVFYKILLEAGRFVGNTATSGEIAFLEADKNGQFQHTELHYTHEDTRRLRHIIEHVYQRILAHDFFAGCQKPECPWCYFERSNTAGWSLRDAEIESLDDPT
jgi:DNA helicase-2/ATP-dependent DNA helicase PcrA